jgi:hypothetical protein
MKLSFAAHSNQATVVRDVLAQGKCDIDNARPKDGGTPLYFASQAGHEEIVEMLVQSRANIDLSTTDDGTTPLYVACEQNKTNVVKRLIVHGADPNKAKTDGATPLHTACFQNNALHVCLLIMAGARKKQKALIGMMPEDVAHSKEHESLKPLLRLPVRWSREVHSQFPEHFRMKVCAFIVSLAAGPNGKIVSVDSLFPTRPQCTPEATASELDAHASKRRRLEVELRLDLIILLQLLACTEWAKTALNALEAAREYRIKAGDQLQSQEMLDTDPERLWEAFYPPADAVLELVNLDTRTDDYRWLFNGTFTEERTIVATEKNKIAAKPFFEKWQKTLTHFNVKTLKEHCRDHLLPMSGKKADLVKRLCEYFWTIRKK